jgi:plastocyanin
MRGRRLGIAVLAVFALSISPAQAANQTVNATPSNQFTPSAVTLNQGEMVTWNNTGGIHNVHFDDNSYVQPPSPSGSAWSVSRTFSTTGTFRYYCEVHGGPGGVGMSGTVTVNPSGPAGYPRPKGATPLSTSLAVAYKPCTSSNRTHGPALASPSCNPPVQESSFLTVGTLDANGQAAASTGLVRLDTKATSPENVKIVTNVTDVRNKTGLTDYTGELQTNLTLRITDRLNAASPPADPYDDPATTVDIAFPVTVPCTATGTADGSTCTVTTTANAVVPGAVTDMQRTIWQLGQVRVFDGGSDGVASTSGNTLFMSEGIFVP